MQIRGQLGELGACALLLTLLLLPSDLAVVVIKVAANLLILRLHVLEILLARVKVMLPASRIVPTIATKQFKNGTMVIAARSISGGR